MNLGIALRISIFLSLFVIVFGIRSETKLDFKQYKNGLYVSNQVDTTQTMLHLQLMNEASFNTTFQPIPRFKRPPNINDSIFRDNFVFSIIRLDRDVWHINVHKITKQNNRLNIYYKLKKILNRSFSGSFYSIIVVPKSDVSKIHFIENNKETKVLSNLLTSSSDYHKDIITGNEITIEQWNIKLSVHATINAMPDPGKTSKDRDNPKVHTCMIYAIDYNNKLVIPFPLDITFLKLMNRTLTIPVTTHKKGDEYSHKGYYYIYPDTQFPMQMKYSVQFMYKDQIYQIHSDRITIDTVH